MLTKTLFVAAALVPLSIDASAGSDPWVDYPGGEGPGAGKHIVLVSGDEEYRSEEALPQLGKILSVRHGFRCTVLFAVDPETGEIDPDNQRNIPGLAMLDDADMLVLFTRFRQLPDDDMKHIVDFVESGKPILGIRTATHAFAYPDDSTSRYARWRWNDAEWEGGFGKQVLGETWVNHHGHHGVESTRGVVVEAAAKHPILRGVDDVWGPTDVYGVRELPPDAIVLLEGAVLSGMSPEDPPVEGEKNTPREPLVWLRERQLEGERKQRVVASTIGAATDCASEGVRRVFVNACYWGVGLEEKIPERSDVTIVGEYEPTAFGFGGYVKGVRPADHALAK
ncbi:MAG: ThuA domain-containing protein [Planctomycetes bacterium]|nr:ThuA domain-containing protein [Planctomycetota bacterium]MCB9903355.1 ThuA domain-containing protein [Planctomycetota bacterium]